MRIFCIYLSVLLSIMIRLLQCASNPLIRSPNLNFQCSSIILISTSDSPLDTTVTAYQILYDYAMGTASLNSSIGVLGCSQDLTSDVLGWKV